MSRIRITIEMDTVLPVEVMKPDSARQHILDMVISAAEDSNLDFALNSDCSTELRDIALGYVQAIRKCKWDWELIDEAENGKTLS